MLLVIPRAQDSRGDITKGQNKRKRKLKKSSDCLKITHSQTEGSLTGLCLWPPYKQLLQMLPLLSDSHNPVVHWILNPQPQPQLSEAFCFPLQAKASNIGNILTQVYYIKLFKWWCFNGPLIFSSPYYKDQLYSNNRQTAHKEQGQRPQPECVFLAPCSLCPLKLCQAKTIPAAAQSLS